MSISNKVKAQIKMIEMGIIPAFTGHELREMMQSLSDEERRRAKRKFRKVWRKTLKKNLKYENCVIPRDNDPVKANHIRNRASIVISEIMKDFI
jgi:hypothetical protein